MVYRIDQDLDVPQLNKKKDCPLDDYNINKSKPTVTKFSEIWDKCNLSILVSVEQLKASTENAITGCIAAK